MGLFDKLLDVLHMDDEDEEFGDPYEPEKATKVKSIESTKNNVARLSEPVKPVSSKPRKTVNAMEVCTIKPTGFEDSREIMETLMSGKPVILNVEGLNVDLAQRIIDICCGATYSIRGNLQKVSNYIFILTPASVDVSGDLQNDLLSNIGYAANESVSTSGLSNSGFGSTGNANNFTSGLR